MGNYKSKYLSAGLLGLTVLGSGCDLIDKPVVASTSVKGESTALVPNTVTAGTPTATPAPSPTPVPTPQVSQITITPKFGETVGLTDSKNATPTLYFTTAVSGADAYECGTALAGTGAKFSACTAKTSVKAALPKGANGTYEFTVHALSGGKIIDSNSVNFYAHPSLTGVAACTYAHSDDEYFKAAANYISMVNSFGPKTSVKAPFVSVQMDKSQHSFTTLRKTLTLNGDSSAVLIKRSFKRSLLGNLIGSKPNAAMDCSLSVGMQYSAVTPGVPKNRAELADYIRNLIYKDNTVFGGAAVTHSTNFTCDVIVGNTIGDMVCMSRDMSNVVQLKGMSHYMNISNRGLGRVAHKKFRSSDPQSVKDYANRNSNYVEAILLND
jgi:hypothetical protein